VNRALADVLTRDLPNLTIVNPALLSGAVAARLLEMAGPHFGKVVFANTGTECTEVCIRFARFVTKRRRFLYLDGSFHGRTYGAISLCGTPELREGQEPLMPTCTPLRRNDLRQLRQELAYGDVAALIVEPVQGMTCEVIDRAWLREAELLCEQHGTLLVIDEVQTGLGRTGDWFASTAMGVRPAMMTISKTLSGGQVPVGAVLVGEDVYQRVYGSFKSGPFYFSTFAENNLAMAASLATLEALKDMDAPRRAAELGRRIEAGVRALAERYDCIDRVAGLGLMRAVYFRPSGKARLRAEQAILGAADPAAFGAAVHVDLYRDHRILLQVPGPRLDAIKVLPAACTTEDDVAFFLAALDDTLGRYYAGQGPALGLGKTLATAAVEQVAAAVPVDAVPPAFRGALARVADALRAKPPDDELELEDDDPPKATPRPDSRDL
jgi:ornithine--oxo-acid transaminase